MGPNFPQNQGKLAATTNPPQFSRILQKFGRKINVQNFEAGRRISSIVQNRSVSFKYRSESFSIVQVLFGIVQYRSSIVQNRSESFWIVQVSFRIVQYRSAVPGKDGCGGGRVQCSNLLNGAKTTNFGLKRGKYNPKSLLQQKMWRKHLFESLGSRNRSNTGTSSSTESFRLRFLQAQIRVQQAHTCFLYAATSLSL